MQTPGLTICIVSYNTRGLLSDCLRQLYHLSTIHSFEVIVTDNGSQDGSVEMLRNEFPQVQVIQNDANEGYTKPMNQALRAGRGQFLMQLNPDTLPQAGFLDELVAFMETHPDVGICSPKVLNRDGSLQLQCRRGEARPWNTLTYMTGLSKLFPKRKTFSGYLMTYLPEDEIAEVKAVSGSCMLIRREVVEQIGYLDEAFFAYQEDSDFCLRARGAGWKVYYVPSARIIHFGGQGGSRVQPMRGIVEWHHSFYLFYRKHYARDYFFLLNGLMYAAMLAKLGLALLINTLRREKIVGSRKP